MVWSFYCWERFRPCQTIANFTSHFLIMASTTKRAEFEAIFPALREDLLAHAKRYNLPENALQWFEKVSNPS
jgi:hypothetical protein